MHQRVTILLTCWVVACSNDGVSTTNAGPNDAPSTTGDGSSGIDVDETTDVLPADTSTGSDEPDDDGGLVLDVAPGGGDDTDDGPCPCVGTGEGIYLLTDDMQMWTFDPDSLEFEHLGAIECPSEGEFQALAIDRQGHAMLSYVLWTPASIVIETYSLALDDLSSCEPIDVGVPAERLLGGMGYANASATDNCDELYVYAFDALDDSAGAGVVARIDAEDGWAELGAIPYEQAMLTGTADGRLFGFVGDTEQASFVGIDIDDAQIIEPQVLPDLNAVNGLGFAFWGGDVWFFTDSAEHDTSKVTRLDHDQSDGGGTTVVVDETPVRFVGAGVSTCVPLTPEG